MSIVLITGMSCSGKDTIRRALEDKYNYVNIVSHTSRPKRENEINGKDYWFVGKENFQNMIDTNNLIEYRSYQTNWQGNIDTWFYGIKKCKLDKNHNYVIVIDLVGAENIIKYFGDENCVTIYLFAPDNVRKQRAIERGSFDNIEWDRRMITDYKDFNYFNLENFKNKHRYKMWGIDNGINGESDIIQITNIIEFIRKGRLYH